MSESCCTSFEVPGGTYKRTYTYTTGTLNSEADPATVSGFRMDKYLVTVGRFRQFVAAWSAGTALPRANSGKHAHLNATQGLVNAAVAGADGGVTYESGWDATDWNNTTDIDPVNGNLACGIFESWTPTAGTQETLPIDCVDWFEAYAFCIWDGGFLPSEAEWEYVAAGGSAQNEFPWGSTEPGTDNLYAIYMCDFPSGSGNCTSASNIAPVGSAPAGAALWGQPGTGEMDMAGEMNEWTLDWSAAYVDPCTDCAYLTMPAAPSDRVFRGGSFFGAQEQLVPSQRDQNIPNLRDFTIGFRCARTP